MEAASSGGEGPATPPSAPAQFRPSQPMGTFTLCLGKTPTWGRLPELESESWAGEHCLNLQEVPLPGQGAEPPAVAAFAVQGTLAMAGAELCARWYGDSWPWGSAAQLGERGLPAGVGQEHCAGVPESVLSIGRAPWQALQQRGVLRD